MTTPYENAKSARTVYILTLMNGARNTLTAPCWVPQPYQLRCSHRHRMPYRASTCYVPGQPSGKPPLQVVAIEPDGTRRLLTEAEWDSIRAVEEQAERKA